ncbi:hypothetical protein PILCRDRAFT_308986 [Piloderma croceum F 1598]|uniref:Uncharacterized protein n=1 Tax=Piloderma croceum (strain F 1598) TaxID=765440 RepID=A0A0C3G477_PILCF|nr:hypothetical protein PILCRDRAFT_308986 [Piloderma croceum F 1598]
MQLILSLLYLLEKKRKCIACIGSAHGFADWRLRLHDFYCNALYCRFLAPQGSTSCESPFRRPPGASLVASDQRSEYNRQKDG